MINKERFANSFCGIRNCIARKYLILLGSLRRVRCLKLPKSDAEKNIIRFEDIETLKRFTFKKLEDAKF